MNTATKNDMASSSNPSLASGNEDGLHKNLVNHILNAAGLSSDELMPLSPIFNVISKRLCSLLSDYTPAKIHAEVATIEPFSVSNIPQVIGKSNIIVPARIEKWSSEILMVLPPELIDLMTTAFFGGTNFLDETQDKMASLKPTLRLKKLQAEQHATETKAEEEDLEELQQTPVERQVANIIIEAIAQATSETFDDSEENFLVLGRSFTSARLDTKEYFSSRFFQCRIKMKIQHIYVNFNLLFPRSCHRFIQNAITKMLQTSSNWADPAWTKRMHEEIRKTNVKVSASIKQGTMSLEELQSLHIGQVLPLVPGSAQNIIITSGKKPLYVGVLGKVSQYLSVRIRDIIDDKNTN